MEYGIATTNKFLMFVDDDECDDPLDVLHRNEEEAAKLKKAEKDNATKNAKGAPKGSATATAKGSKTTSGSKSQTVTPTIDPPKGKATTHEPAKRENTGTNADNRPPRFGGKQNENRPPKSETESGNQGQRRDNTTKVNEFRERIGNGDSRGEDFRGRGGFRRGGRGGGRGGEHGDNRVGFGGNNEGGFDRFGKREFDRRSGSDRGGMKPVDKREGGGAHNWGTIKDDIEEQLKPVENPGVDQVEKVEPEQSNEVVAENAGGDTAPMTAEEDPIEEKQMTLDEWKQLQEQSKLKATFNVRQANEGCNDPKWKKMYQLKKKDDNEEEEEEEEDEDDQHVKHKQILPTNFTFVDSHRSADSGRGGRGGRGRGGRGRGVGGGRSSFGGGAAGKAEVQPPNVADEADFPSLG